MNETNADAAGLRIFGMPATHIAAPHAFRFPHPGTYEQDLASSLLKIFGSEIAPFSLELRRSALGFK